MLYDYITCNGDEYFDYVRSDETITFEYDGEILNHIHLENYDAPLTIDGDSFGFYDNCYLRIKFDKDSKLLSFYTMYNYELEYQIAAKNRVDTFVEKLIYFTKGVTICDDNGVLADKFETLVNLIREYESLPEEMRNEIDVSEAFDGYNCYEVIQIVTRGLLKTGNFESTLSQKIILQRKAILSWEPFVIIFAVASSLIFILLIRKKKR